MEEINKILEKLLEQCKLGNMKEMPVRVSGGLLNRMYKVITDNGIYAIKLLNPEVMKRENAKDNHIFAETISNIAKDNGVSCLPAKIINNAVLQLVEGYYFLIFDWFEGKSIEDEELTLDKVSKVAKELVKIHNIDFKGQKDKCKAYYENNIIDWKFYIDKIENKEIQKLLFENMKRFSELDIVALDSLNNISKNLIISHRDLDLPNILWDKSDNPIIIDWESSGLINPSMEVIDTAWNWSGGQNYFDKEKYQLFVKTYKENGGNLNEYNEALKAVFKAKFGWLEYNLKRVCGIECIDEEERKLGESEVKRTISEINKFDICISDMKI